MVGTVRRGIQNSASHQVITNSILQSVVIITYRILDRSVTEASSKDTEDAKRFREAREAYETLVDEDTRRQYDATLKSPSIPVCIPSVTDEIKQRSSAVKEVNRFASFMDEFFEGFVPAFFHKECYRPPRKDLYYEVILSPSEAMNGGVFPIRVPVIENCPRCHQTGFMESFFCPDCDGRGYRQAERGFSLSIPPRMSNGTEAKISLEDTSLPDAKLFVRVYIDPYLE